MTTVMDTHPTQGVSEGHGASGSCPSTQSISACLSFMASRKARSLQAKSCCLRMNSNQVLVTAPRPSQSPSDDRQPWLWGPLSSLGFRRQRRLGSTSRDPSVYLGRSGFGDQTHVANGLAAHGLSSRACGERMFKEEPGGSAGLQETRQAG